MFNKECPAFVRARLIESYHRDSPKDGPRMKKLKEYARQLPIETIWEEIDAWSTAQVSASLGDLEDSRS